MGTRIKDIARELGISESTVSRALSDHPKISNSTKEEVRQAANELNYQPDLIAKSLKLKQTKTIGVIISDITNPFYPEIIKGAEDVANKNSLNIFLCNSDYNRERQQNYLKVLAGKRVDGIIISPIGEKYEIINFLIKNRIPFVLIDIKPAIKIETDCVYADTEYGAYIGVKHLIELGHKKIAIINGPIVNSPCKQLKSGYMKAIEEDKIPINEKYLKECNLKTEGGYRAVKELLKLGKEEIPTAAIFISDITAIGAYDAIYESNMKIPDDFSILGYDDIPGAKYFFPPLTTVAQPKYELGETAMKLLIGEFASADNWKHKQIKILPKLIIRSSTAKPPDR
ncbi:MAG: LacI family transcriptional regulator [Actinobacteria bacterium]|nr:LacI family transcriptional regulator [Actinomycetota bacterium]